jgi:O-antigen/teichoic acid export membrane protein
VSVLRRKDTPSQRRERSASGGRNLALAEILSFVAPLAVLPAMTRALGTDAYGRLQFVMALGIFAEIAANPGLGTVATRRAARNPHGVGALVSRLQPLRALCSATAALILAAVPVLLGWPAHTTVLVLLQAGVIVAQGLSVDPYLMGLGDLAWIGRTRVLSLVVYAAGVILLVREPADAHYVLGTTLAATLCLTAAGWVRLRTQVGGWRWSPRLRTTRRLLAEGLGFALSSVMQLVYARVDILFLRAMRGEGTVGLYAGCVRLTEGPYAVVNIVSGTLYPRAIAESRRDIPRNSAYAQRAMRRTMAFVLPALVGGSVAGGAILMAFLGPAFSGGDAPFAILSAALAAGATASILTAFGLVAAGKGRVVLGITAAAAATNVVLNFVAVPLLGAAGAALTTLLSQGIVAVLAAQASREWLRIDLLRAMRPWLLPSLAMGAAVLVARLAGAGGLALLMLGAVAYPVAVAAFGHVPRADRRGAAQLLRPLLPSLARRRS